MKRRRPCAPTSVRGGFRVLRGAGLLALAAAAAAANAAANAPPADDASSDGGDNVKNDPEAAHAAAFVDLVHALSNANDFLYRF